MRVPTRLDEGRLSVQTVVLVLGTLTLVLVIKQGDQQHKFATGGCAVGVTTRRWRRQKNTESGYSLSYEEKYIPKNTVRVKEKEQHSSTYL